MAEINTLRALGLDALFAIHGVPATYKPIDGGSITTLVKIEPDIDRYELESGQLITSERRTLIRVRITEVTESKRRDMIVTESGETFTVDEVEGDNGFVRTLLVRSVT